MESISILNAGFHKTGMLTIQNRNIKWQFLGKFSATLRCKSISYDAKKKSIIAGKTSIGMYQVGNAVQSQIEPILNQKTFSILKT